MAHPMAGKSKSGRQIAKARYADGGAASFDERYPRGVWSGGSGPSIDQAFSGSDPSKTEFPLGNALREKAKKMREK